MIIQHKHIIINALVEAPPHKAQTADMANWFKRLIDNLGMKLLSGPHVEYCDMEGNKGFTGVAIIETSHIALHVWDEETPAVVRLDVYTCGDLDPAVVFTALDEFKPVSVVYRMFDRETGITEQLI